MHVSTLRQSCALPLYLRGHALRSARVRTERNLRSTARLGYSIGSSSSSSPSPALSTWIDQLTSSSPTFATDHIDGSRALQLIRTLPTRLGRTTHPDSAVSLVGHELPKAHHLVYFQPDTRLDQLGADGSTTVRRLSHPASYLTIPPTASIDRQDYNAPPPYTRRMWAGGSFAWNHLSPLKIGSSVLERTHVERVEVKKDLVFVHQSKTLFPLAPPADRVDTLALGEAERDVDESSWSVKEMRTHVFRTDEGVHRATAASGKPDRTPYLDPPLIEIRIS